VIIRQPRDRARIRQWRQSHGRAIVTGDRDLLDHPGLNPPALTVRAACELLDI
jgi:hypothetical protein